MLFILNFRWYFCLIGFNHFINFCHQRVWKVCIWLFAYFVHDLTANITKQLAISTKDFLFYSFKWFWNIRFYSSPSSFVLPLMLWKNNLLSWQSISRHLKNSVCKDTWTFLTRVPKEKLKWPNWHQESTL